MLDIYTILILLPIVFVAYLSYRIFHCNKKLQAIPGLTLMKSLEALFSGKPYDIMMEEYYDSLLNEHKIVRSWSPIQWMVLVSSSSLAKDIFMNPKKYPKNIPQDIFPKALFSKFMGVNVIFSNNETWKRHRAIVNPPFHKQFDANIFGIITKEFINILLNEKGVKDVDVFSYMQSITIDALGKAVLDVDFNAINNTDAPFLNAYNNVLTHCFKPMYLIFPFLDQPWNPIRKPLFDDLAWLKNYFDNILNERRKEIGTKIDDKFSNVHDDLLTLMIQSQEYDGMDNKELMDNILGFFLAGHETTACVLGVALYYLAKYPQIQDKLYHEVRQLLKDPDAIPTNEQTKEMHYLFAIMEESIRLYPPVSRLPDRICAEDVEFNGNIIPKGTRLALSIYSLHRDPDLWGPDATEFKPERFLDEAMQDKISKNKFLMNGFGGGSRVCLGQNFSRLEQKVVLSMLVNKFEIGFSKRNTSRDRIKLTPHPILYPKELYLDFKLRN